MTTREDETSLIEQLGIEPSRQIAVSPDLLPQPRSLRVAADTDDWSARGSRRRVRPYVVRAAVVDAVMLIAALLVAWPLQARWVSLNAVSERPGFVLGAIVFVLWALALVGWGCYDPHHVGVGLEEYKRITAASFVVLALIGITSYIGGIQSSRGFVAVSLTLGLVLLLGGRYVLRRWLDRVRSRGQCLSRTVVIGLGEHADQLAARLHEDPTAGFVVVGRVRPPGDDESIDAWLETTEQVLDDLTADAVAIAEMSGIDSNLVRRLAWQLEGPRIDLLVAPTLSDLAGPRISIRPASGLPLIHLDEPQLNGPKAITKRAVDVLVSLVSLLLLAPLLAVIAVAIKMTSAGPVLFTQERVGHNGETFSFFKFRTMIVGADDMRAEVIGCPDDDISDRYRTDPRITRVGRLLRRWSLDELPQLVHVVGGTMSLVGPRPLLLAEMPLLAEGDHRRHMTKPGLTGLWQVSGRKDVDWDERMRLDLWYVENWSPALDLVIVARTARAVITGQGAY